ncbi:hypothetical protein L0938_15345 [Paracidovorax citrulli]
MTLTLLLVALVLVLLLVLLTFLVLALLILLILLLARVVLLIGHGCTLLIQIYGMRRWLLESSGFRLPCVLCGAGPECSKPG